MLKQAFFFFSITLFFLTGSAQHNFYKTYSSLYNVDPGCIIQLRDSGYIIYSSDNSLNPDQELRRLDKFGNVIWYKKLTSPSFTERSGAITLTANNHILIAGRYNSSINLFKLDLNGNFIFRKVYSGVGSPVKVVEDARGYIYIIGDYAELIKTDSIGTLKWKKSYTATNYLHGVMPFSANKTILVGTAINAVGVFSANDIVHIYIDSMGNILNQKGYGTNASEIANEAFRDGSKIFTPFRYLNYPLKDTAIGILCTDTTGTQLWTKLLSGNFIHSFGRTFGASILNDNSLICYSSEPTPGNNTFHLIHFGNDGKVLKHSSIPTSSNFAANSYPCLGAASDGGYFLMGSDIITGGYGLLKVGANLSPFCKNTIQQKILERRIVLSELSYSYSIPNLFPTTSNSTFSLTPLTSTISSACVSPTCNTISSFKGSSGTICMGSTISFTNNGQNFSSTLWKIDGISLAASTNFSNVFNFPGTHTITLVLNGACIDSSSHVIFVDSIPNPNFTWTSKLLKSRFEPAKYKNGMYLSWDFGDGTPINTCLDTISHGYRSYGTYSVCLTESNTCANKQICKPVSFSQKYANNFYMSFQNTVSATDNQYGTSVLQMSDGTYFAAGSDDSYGSSGSDALLNRLDSAGNLMKSNIVFTGQAIDCSVPSNDGGAILFGTGNGRHYFGQVDSSASLYFATSFSVISTSDIRGNGIELADGRMVFSGSNNTVGYLTGFRKNGTLWFYRTYSGFRNIYSIQRAPSGHFYAFGNNQANTDFCLMKLDSSFNFLWIKTFDLGSTQCLAGDMKISTSEKIYMTGTYNATLQEVILMAVDSSGNSLFSHKYTRSFSRESGRSMILDKKGNIFISSCVVVYGGSIIKLDSLGNTLSTSPSPITIYKITSTFDNGIALGATSYSMSGLSAKFSCIKLDSTGMLSCATPTLLTRTTLTPTVNMVSTTIFSSTPVFSKHGTSAPYWAYDTLVCGGTVFLTDIPDPQHKNSNVKVFPNPTNSSVTVILENEDFVSLKLINCSGQSLFEDTSKNSKLELDLQLYEPGLYFIKIENKDGSSVIQKVVKLD